MKPNSFACEHNARSRDPQERATGALPASTMLAPGLGERERERREPHHWRARNTLESGDRIFFQRSGLLYYSPAVNVNTSGLV